MEELFDSIRQRLEYVGKNPGKFPEHAQACDKFGTLAADLHARFKRGDKEDAIKFAEYWMQWMMATNLVTREDIEKLSADDRQALNILYNEKGFKVKEGRWTALDSRVEVSGRAEIAAFGNSVLTSIDHTMVTLYDYSYCKVKGGFAYAFHQSRIDVAGPCIVEAYDKSHVDGVGPSIITLYDHAEAATNSDWLVRKRQAKHISQDGPSL